MRTQEEIVARVEEVATGDILGFQREVLLPCLTYENAKRFLKEGFPENEWFPSLPVPDDSEVRLEMANYMKFAWGKVEGHRGISASRSITKMCEYLWLLGDDDMVARVTEAPYTPYGAPALKLICDKYEFPVPETASVQRMIKGKPCEPGCESGCLL